MRKSEARSEIIRLLHYGRQNLSLSAQQQDALEIAIDWLELKTDFRDTYQGIKPEDKLVKCGCGGKAETHELFGQYSGTYMTDCKECGTGTTQYSTKKESQDAWNTAMSGGEKDETQA